jgi:hypothetical protein
MPWSGQASVGIPDSTMLLEEYLVMALNVVNITVEPLFLLNTQEVKIQFHLPNKSNMLTGLITDYRN